MIWVRLEEAAPAGLMYDEATHSYRPGRSGAMFVCAAGHESESCFVADGDLRGCLICVVAHLARMFPVDRRTP